MEGLGDELDELEAEMAALEMETDPVHVDTIHVDKEKEPIVSQKEEEKDPLAAMMAMPM